MRVIGVIDLLAGRAVHARAGARETYAPVSAIAGFPVEPGNALVLAREYITLGVGELYVADLDAILGGRPQDAVVAAIAALGAPLWLDAAVSSVDQARHALDLGTTHAVVGLETLASFDVLDDICAVVGAERISFSLDLRDGQPIVRSDGIARNQPTHLIAARAAHAGVGSVIVIDLARVGTGAGLDLEMVAGLRKAILGLPLLAGGGVRGIADLKGLANAGCDGALVATALQDGRLSAANVAVMGALSDAKSWRMANG